jgi:hypothetical protein
MTIAFPMMNLFPIANCLIPIAFPLMGNACFVVIDKWSVLNDTTVRQDGKLLRAERQDNGSMAC